jgi:hypothetical protein
VNVQLTTGFKVSLSVIALASGGFNALAAPANGQTPRTAAGPTRSIPALPAALRPALYQTLAADTGSAYRIDSDGCAVLPKQRLKACFDRHGTHFTSNVAAPLTLRLVAYGRSNALVSVTPIRPEIKGNEVR